MTKPIIRVDNRNNLHDIIEKHKEEAKSVTKRPCKTCGKPCGKKVYFTWLYGKRVAHNPKCRMLKKR